MPLVHRIERPWQQRLDFRDVIHGHAPIAINQHGVDLAGHQTLNGIGVGHPVYLRMLRFGKARWQFGFNATGLGQGAKHQPADHLLFTVPVALPFLQRQIINNRPVFIPSSNVTPVVTPRWPLCGDIRPARQSQYR